ncbi:hypothetical protein Pelo_15271 [Pelomyxa schiedti]|nr:hypothetical protein Pelo_15271 [Pelomyxa schiedti]
MTKSHVATLCVSLTNGLPFSDAFLAEAIAIADKTKNLAGIKRLIVNKPQYLKTVGSNSECVAGQLKAGCTDIVVRILQRGEPPVGVLRASVKAAVKYSNVEVLGCILSMSNAYEECTRMLWNAGKAHACNWDPVELWRVMCSPKSGNSRVYPSGLSVIEPHVTAVFPDSVVSKNSLEAAVALHLPGFVRKVLDHTPSLGKNFVDFIKWRVDFDNSLDDVAIAGFCSGAKFPKCDITSIIGKMMETCSSREFYQSCASCAATYSIPWILRILDRIPSPPTPKELILADLLTPSHINELVAEDINEIVACALCALKDTETGWMVGMETIIRSDAQSISDWIGEAPGTIDQIFSTRRSGMLNGKVVLLLLQVIPTWRATMAANTLRDILLWVNDGDPNFPEICSAVLQPATKVSALEFVKLRPKRLAELLTNCKFSLTDHNNPFTVKCYYKESESTWHNKSTKVTVTPLTFTESNRALCELLRGAGAKQLGGVWEGIMFCDQKHLASLLGTKQDFKFF